MTAEELEKIAIRYDVKHPIETERGFSIGDKKDAFIAGAKCASYFSKKNAIQAFDEVYEYCARCDKKCSAECGKDCLMTKFKEFLNKK